MSIFTFLRKWNFIALGFILIYGIGCSSSNILNVQDVKDDSDVKIYLIDGSIYEGLVTQRTKTELIIVDKNDHRPHAIELRSIRRVEKSSTNYDHLANPISQAEMETYKTSKNAWGYAIGGAVMGGLVGLAVGLPFWYAEVGNISPWFTAGLGAIGGSIIFAKKGVEKDNDIALQKVRYIRLKEQELEREKKEEEERLKELQKEKEELQKKLNAQKSDIRD